MINKKAKKIKVAKERSHLPSKDFKNTAKEKF